MDVFEQKVEDACMKYVKEHPEGYSIDKQFFVETRGVLIYCKGIDSKGKVYDISSLTINKHKITSVKDVENGDLEKFLSAQGIEF